MTIGPRLGRFSFSAFDVFAAFDIASSAPSRCAACCSAICDTTETPTFAIPPSTAPNREKPQVTACFRVIESSLASPSRATGRAWVRAREASDCLPIAGIAPQPPVPAPPVLVSSPVPPVLKSSPVSSLALSVPVPRLPKHSPIPVSLLLLSSPLFASQLAPRSPSPNAFMASPNNPPAFPKESNEKTSLAASGGAFSLPPRRSRRDASSFFASACNAYPPTLIPVRWEVLW
mmetsp:Transcript_7981/g.29862  ORF Transcript_7981/g.29862 Transcript_7981/m.29862 type:complete len:232 (+) Transcript_7981:91-786(+)